jgi:Aspartyl protease/PDZ domain
MIRPIAFFSALFVSTIVTVAAASAEPTPGAIGAAQIAEVLVQAHVAAGGTQLDGYGAMTQSGSFAQNGGPSNPFEGVVDLRNGYSRIRLVVGPATFLQGYDGTQWGQQNGVLAIVSLPSLVADAVTQAYLSSYAFFRRDQVSTLKSGHEENVDGQPAYVLHAEPRGGSPADLYFDASSYRLVKVVAQTAQGIDTTTNSDFQVVQGVTVAMRSVDVNASGTTSVTTLKTIQFSTSLEPSATARPSYVSHGTLAAPVSIPFVSDLVGGLGHVVVPVSLNDKPATLVFDSGGANFLVPDAARSLGLQASGGIATGGAGAQQQMTAYAHVASVDFGGARLSDQNFVVTPLSYPLLHPRKDLAIEGLIGFEYLANFRVSVRYADREIDLAPFDQPAPSGGVTLPFKSDGAHAYVLATVDKASGYYLLDTGNAGGIVLTAPFVKEHHLFPKGGPIYRSPGGVGGGYSETHAAAKTFVFAGQTYRDVPVSIPQVTSGFFATRGVAGNLGSAFLSRFTVVFDYQAQTVTFVPNRNVAMPFRADRIGWSLGQDDPRDFEVHQVVPGGPAANAGIAMGDRVTAFAGNQVAAGFGLGDLSPYSTGNAPFTVTVNRASVGRTVTLRPTNLLPPPQ